MESRKESEDRLSETNTISRRDWVAEAVAVAKRVTKDRELGDGEEQVRKPGLDTDDT